MEILKNFGFDPTLLVAQIVNFLIILYLLKRFAYKPMIAVLEKRRKTIAEGQKNAEKANKALEEALEKEKKILQTAQAEAKAMMADANKQSETIITTAHEKGKQQVEKIIKDTKEQLERERKETEKQIAVHVNQLAIDILQKSLQGFFDEKQQKEVMEKAVKSLKK